jgi:hypothetical protein
MPGEMGSIKKRQVFPSAGDYFQAFMPLQASEETVGQGLVPEVDYARPEALIIM